MLALAVSVLRAVLLLVQVQVPNLFSSALTDCRSVRLFNDGGFGELRLSALFPK